MLALLTRDDGTVGRQPWVTCALVALVIGGYVYAHNAARDAVREAEIRLAEARGYFQQHPYVDLDPRMAHTIGVATAEHVRAEYFEQRRARGLPLLPDRIKQRAQRAFDVLARDAFEHVDALPLWRSAVRDVSSPAGNLLAHVAFHETWAAVAVSVAFLLLAGAALEDAWGRPVYTGLLLLGTLAGAIAFRSLHADASTPWIGASGVCAALLGAHAVRFPRRGPHLFGGLRLPFWVLVPLFLVADAVVVRGVALDDPGSISRLVPWGALLVPMGLGAAVALTTRALGLDARLRQRPSDAPLVANPVLERAMQAREAGDDAQAFILLQAALKQAPGNRDAALALWDLALSLDRAREAAPVMVRLVRDALQRGQGERAVEQWLVLTEHAGEVDADPVLLVRIAERLLDAGRPENALAALRRAVGGRGRPMASALAMRTVRLARDLDPDLTLRAAQSALRDRDLSPGDRQELEMLVASLGDRPAAPAAPGPPASTPAAPSSTPASAPAASATDPDDPEDLSALDPHALRLDAVQRETDAAFGAPGSVEGVDEDAMQRWNDPGLVEDLSEELPDAVALGARDWSEGDLSLESHGAISLDPDEDVSMSVSAPVDPPPTVPQDLGGLGTDLGETTDPHVPEPSALTGADRGGWEAPADLLAGDTGYDLGVARSEAAPSGAAPPAPDLDRVVSDREIGEAAALVAREGLGDGPEPASGPAPRLDLGPDLAPDLDLDLEPDPEPEPEPRALRVLDVVPLSLEEDSIKFEVAGKGKSRAPFTRIDAVAVAVVRGLGPKPVIVLDLALNWRAGTGEILKLLRLRSDRFNPRRLFPDETSALDALRRLVATLLDASGATPLPDTDRVLPASSQGFARFPDLASYERDLWAGRAE